MLDEPLNIEAQKRRVLDSEGTVEPDSYRDSEVRVNGKVGDSLSVISFYAFDSWQEDDFGKEIQT
jgi:hypothetical protein